MRRGKPLKRSKPLAKSKSDPTTKCQKRKPEAKPKYKKDPCPSVATLDRLYSDYIRRFQSCELHGYGNVPCSQQLQCSHIHSRTYHSVRWLVEPRNAICACAAHHRWQHNNPTLSTWALEEILGKEHLKELQRKFLVGRKPTPEEKRNIAAFLREEIRRAA